MTPAPTGRPPLTEAEYWRDYDIIRNDINAAMVSCYTEQAIHQIAATDTGVLERINRNADFWRVTTFGLQNSLFIVLARILDHHPNFCSIYRVLNATTAHPEFFSRASLRARKLGVSPWDAADLDAYVRNAWEPTLQNLREIKKSLVPHKAKFDAIYRPIRDQIAHNILTDNALVADLYSRTQRTDIDEILCFLHNLFRAIWELAFNAMQPDLDGDKYGYAERVAEITQETERLLRHLP